MTPEGLVVSSRQNAAFKELRALAQGGGAYKAAGRIWLEGEHLCEAAALRGHRAELAVVSEEYTHLAQAPYLKAAAKTMVLSAELMKSISTLGSAAGVGMLIRLPPESGIQAQARSVVLDRLQDPGNVGSIVRSAAAFGFTQIIALQGCVALWSPKVLRSAMGAHFSLGMVEGVAAEALAQLKTPLAVTSSHRGRFLHELSAAALPDLDLGRVSWIFGHEGQGVSTPLEQLAQAHIRIVQPGGQESLNVAAAAAICLHASAAWQAALPRPDWTEGPSG